MTRRKGKSKSPIFQIDLTKDILETERKLWEAEKAKLEAKIKQLEDEIERLNQVIEEKDATIEFLRGKIEEWRRKFEEMAVKAAAVVRSETRKMENFEASKPRESPKEIKVEESKSGKGDVRKASEALMTWLQKKARERGMM